jgi:pyruvate kinase
MARIALRADIEFDYAAWAERVTALRDQRSAAPAESITDAMTLATWRAANELDLAALLCISGIGVHRAVDGSVRPNVPIIGLTTNDRTAQQLTLSWGVKPLLVEPEWSYEFRVNKAVAAVEGRRPHPQRRSHRCPRRHDRRLPIDRCAADHARPVMGRRVG